MDKNKLQFKSFENKLDFAYQIKKYNYSDDVKNGVAYYGKYNDLPKKYLSLLDDSHENATSSTWHGIAVEAIVKYTKGDGLVLSNGQELEEANSYQETYNEVFEKTAWDYKLYGGFAIEVIWDKSTVAGLSNPKIAEIYHLPFKDIRAKEKNYRGKIEGYYISPDWKKFKMPTDEKVQFFPVFNPSLASYSEEEGRDPQPKQILVVKRPNPASEYYPEPDYKPALTDILIDSQIRKFKLSKLGNDIATNLIVQIVGEFNGDDYEDMANDFEEQYLGAQKAGTPILMNAARGADAHIFTTPSNSKGNAETYNSYVEDARQRILSTHGITFGEIVGIDDGKSLFGDEKSEKYQTFLNTSIRDIQMPMLSGWNKLSRYKFGEGVGFEINPIDISEGLERSQGNITDEEEDTLENQIINQ